MMINTHWLNNKEFNIKDKNKNKHKDKQTSRADAQLSLYFGSGGDSQKELKRSQSHTNLLQNTKSSSSEQTVTGSSIDLSENKEDGNDVDDIYSIVAWQLGHGDSISDGDNPKDDEQKKVSSLSKRNRLKWYKKLFGQKSKPSYQRNKTLDAYSPSKDDETEEGKDSVKNKPKLKRSKSTTNIDKEDELNLNDSPLSIKLKSATNRDIRFECLLYEKKKGKLRYKLIDHTTNKCISSNMAKFDIKDFLSKKRMSIDHELQLIQTIQQYKQTVKDKDNTASSSDTSSSVDSVTVDTEYDEGEDEDSSTFDLHHITTPRTKYNPSSRFMQFQHIISVIFHRYEKHTKRNPYLPNYLSLRKKQQNIENFYREKVADTNTILLITDDNSDNSSGLKRWDSGKLGLKSLLLLKKAKAKQIANANKKIATPASIENANNDTTAFSIKMNLSVQAQSGYSGDESSMMELSSVDNVTHQQDEDTVINDINDGYLTDDEEDEDELNESEEEQTLDDSDASMDSDTFKRILSEAKEIENEAKQQRLRKETKSKTKQSKKGSKSKSKSKQASKKKKDKDDLGSITNASEITYASLKPPSKSKGKRKKSKSKRKGLKKRKKRAPRFMQSKSVTPRKAHKLNYCDLDESQIAKDKDKAKKKNKEDETDKSVKKKRKIRRWRPSVIKRLWPAEMPDNEEDDENMNIYIDELTYNSQPEILNQRLESPGYTKTSHSDVGNLRSPHYLRLKAKNYVNSKAIPVKMLDFSTDDK